MRNKNTTSMLRVALCAVFATAATFAAVAQQQRATGGTDELKTTLLRPAGWMANWALQADTGQSEIVFEPRGDRIVAKIRNLTYPTTCERDVTVSSNTVKFDGCYDFEITLRFDPADKAYPLKGTSRKGYDYKVQPRDAG